MTQCLYRAFSAGNCLSPVWSLTYCQSEQTVSTLSEVSIKHNATPSFKIQDSNALIHSNYIIRNTGICIKKIIKCYSCLFFKPLAWRFLLKNGTTAITTAIKRSEVTISWQYGTLSLLKIYWEMFAKCPPFIQASICWLICRVDVCLSNSVHYHMASSIYVCKYREDPACNR